MSEIQNLRLLQAAEIASVSGGDIVVTGSPPIDPHILDQLDRLRFSNVGLTDGNYGGGGGGGAVGDGEWDPDGDDDGDGIPNQEEEIVVIGDPSAPDRVLESYRNIASWIVNYFYYSGIATGGYLGLAGRSGAVYAVGLELGSNSREDMIESMAQSMFDGDVSDDGVANGSIWLQPGQDPDMEPGFVYYL